MTIIGQAVGMRVNLGCGEHYVPGWVNVDHRSPHRHDLTADLTQPLPDTLDNISDVYAGHVLEHMDLADVTRLLADLHRRMLPGGRIMIVGPDVVRARAMHAAGQLDDSDLRLIVEGGGRWPGDRHRWECQPSLLIAMLEAAGWQHADQVPLLSVSDVDWPIVSWAPWQCAVTGYA